MTAPFNPFEGPEWRATQAHLLIGIQYAVYEFSAFLGVGGACLLFWPQMPEIAGGIGVAAAFNGFRHIHRLTKLGRSLDKHVDNLETYYPSES